MSWERRLAAMLDDLEQRAESADRAARDAEVADLARGEYRQVTLESRLHASLGATVRLEVDGAGAVAGRLARAGAGWALVGVADAEVLVALPAVGSAGGLSPLSVPEQARDLGARLGLPAVLRRAAEDGDALSAVLRGGRTCRGRVRRVGADFVELDDEVVATAALATLRRVG